MKKLLSVLMCLFLALVFAIDTSKTSLAQTNASFADIDLDEIRTDFFKKINNQRNKAGIDELTYDNRLEIISQKHAEYMMEHFLNKNDAYNRNPGRRLEAEGFEWWAIGENIGIIYLDSDIQEVLKNREWIFEYTPNDPLANRLDKDFTNIAIGVSINEERKFIYICVDYYTPYTNQKERKRPYAELIPGNLGVWHNEEDGIVRSYFNFKNTGNTNLTDIQIEVNLKNIDDEEEIIATGTLDFQDILTPGQSVTLYYETEPFVYDEEKEYIHIYNIKSFKPTKKEHPEHYFTKNFSMKKDDDGKIALDARLMNMSDKSYNFHCYATYYIPTGQGYGFVRPVGKSKTISKYSIQPGTGRDIVIDDYSMNPEAEPYISRVEVTYWFEVEE
ncbi:MAG: CAP domain-containing protein [Caldisericia bacterium]